jgi:hypothetical protein
MAAARIALDDQDLVALEGKVSNRNCVSILVA